MVPYILSLFPIVLFINWRTNRKAFKRAMIIWFFVLVVLAGLRGNMTADFTAYKNIFINYSGYNLSRLRTIFNISYHLNVWEIGYVIENFLVSRFTDNYMWVQIVSAIITYGCLFYFLKDSIDPVLSILLFLSIGIFLEGFNTVRNVMAACIYSLSIKYMVNRDFKKYTAVVLVASLFHSTAIIMLPFYFILNKKPNVIMIMLYVIAAGVVLLSIKYITLLLNGVFSFTVRTDRIYEMLYRHKYSFGAVFFSVAFSVFCLLLYYYGHKFSHSVDHKQENVLANGVIIWLILRLFMMKFGYTERFAEYFSVFILLLLPMQLNKFNRQTRLIVKIIISVVLIGYYLYSSQSLYGPYISIIH